MDLDLVISLCLQGDNQNFTLVLDHYSQASAFKCGPTAILLSLVHNNADVLFLLKTVFQLANTGGLDDSLQLFKITF